MKFLEKEDLIGFKMFFEKVGVGLESKALRAQCLEKSERFFIFELCSKMLSSPFFRHMIINHKKTTNIILIFL